MRGSLSGAIAHLHGCVVVVILRINAAVIAHLNKLEIIGTGVHPVFAVEFFDDSLDRGFDTEFPSTLDTSKGFFTV